MRLEYMLQQKQHFLENFSLENSKVYIVENDQGVLYSVEWNRHSTGSIWNVKNLSLNHHLYAQISLQDLEKVLQGEGIAIENLHSKITDDLLHLGVHMKHALQTLEHLCGVKMLETAEEQFQAFHNQLCTLLEEHLGKKISHSPASQRLPQRDNSQAQAHPPVALATNCIHKKVIDVNKQNQDQRSSSMSSHETFGTQKPKGKKKITAPSTTFEHNIPIEQYGDDWGSLEIGRVSVI